VNELSKQDLRRILIEPKNSLLKQYKQIFKLNGVDLEIEDNALDIIIDNTLKRKVGARGLRGELERLLIDIMFDFPFDEKVKKCVIDQDYVLGKRSKPILLDDNSKEIEYEREN